MKRPSGSTGFSIIEMLIAVGLVAILATVATVAYVGYQRSSETVDSLATVSIMRERLAVSRALAGEQLLTCDNSLTEPGDLDDLYMDLTISAVPLDEADPTQGYGGGVAIVARADTHGANGVAAAQQLHEQLSGQGADIRGAILTDSAVSFTVLVTDSDQPHCLPPGSALAGGPAPQTPTTPPQTPSGTPSTGSVAPAVQPVQKMAEPVARLSLSAKQQIMDTGTSGRAIARQLDTGGDMDGVTLEFSVVGRQGGDASASTGPVIFNYGSQSNNNLISAWRPSNFTIAFGGRDYATGINIADGNNHRVTMSWDSATGELKVFDNGVLAKSFSGVMQGQSLTGNGHLVVGQKMNNPGSGDGWIAAEHYSGQVFGTTLSTHVYSDQEIAGAPLYARSQDIIADLRNEGGSLQDLTGRHSVEMQGDHATSTVDVDTALALIPPGSEVRLGVTAQAGDSNSQIESIELSGLGSLTVSDGVNSGSGSVDITSWNLSGLQIQLPPGFTSNQQITLTVTATDGTDSAQASDTQVLRMQP